MTAARGKLLTVVEAAARLGMAQEALRREIAARRIQVLRRGRALGIYEAWTDEYVERQSIPATGDSRGVIEEQRSIAGIRDIREIVPRQSVIGN